MSSFHTFSDTAWSCLRLLIHHSSIYFCHLADAVIQNDLTVILNDRSWRTRCGFQLLSEGTPAGGLVEDTLVWSPEHHRAGRPTWPPLVSAHWTQREAPRPHSNRAMAGEVGAELGLCVNCEVLMKGPDKGTGDAEMMWVVTGRGNRAFFSLWNKPQLLADPNRKLNQPSKWVLDIWFLCSWEPQVKGCLL